MEEIEVSSDRREDLIDITSRINDKIRSKGWEVGVLTIFVPHTTAGITVNEHADPDVATDIIEGLSRLIPYRASYRHTEGNADAHIKSSIVGCSLQIIVEGGRMKLGTWQGIFFCEFDGPRKRKVWLMFNKA